VPSEAFAETPPANGSEMIEVHRARSMGYITLAVALNGVLLALLAFRDWPLLGVLLLALALLAGCTGYWYLREPLARVSGEECVIRTTWVRPPLKIQLSEITEWRYREETRELQLRMRDGRELTRYFHADRVEKELLFEALRRRTSLYREE